MKQTRNALIIIDAQNDFILDGAPLQVPNALEDSKRTADFIQNNADEIDHITLTLDSHRVVDISHPSWWKKKDGSNADPFTAITLEDIDNGTYTPRFDPVGSRNYVETLENQGEFGHFIWPEHCIIGTEGHAIEETVLSAVHDWERVQGGMLGAEYVTKGTNPRTEHFGAFRAQVPMAGSPETQPNLNLLDKFQKFETVFLCGQARTHCVANSLNQILELAPELAQKLVVLDDATSNIDGFEAQAQPIYDKAKQMGVRFSTTTAGIQVVEPSMA